MKKFFGLLYLLTHSSAPLNGERYYEGTFHKDRTCKFRTHQKRIFFFFFFLIYAVIDEDEDDN